MIKRNYKKKVEIKITKNENQNQYLVPKDEIQNQYLVAARDQFWCIDATYIFAGSLILIIDLASRLILAHSYLHGVKANEFKTRDVIQLIDKCLIARRIAEKKDRKKDLIIHSDRGGQFLNEEFANFALIKGFKHSANEKPTNNQVIENANKQIKEHIRLKIAPQDVYKFKPGAANDPLRKLMALKKEEILEAIQFAIEAHNNKALDHNNNMSPFEYDNALFDTNLTLPVVISAKNDDSVDAQIIREFRNEVTIEHATNWAQFFSEWKEKNNLQFEQARLERVALYEQNRVLITKIEEQSKQIQELIEFQRKLNDKEALRLQLKEKRAKAKKLPPRDTISSEEFENLIRSLKTIGTKDSRNKVAFTILYLTGLRISNLLIFTVRHLEELIEKKETRILINKNGGVRKILVPSEAKKWFHLIEKEIDNLTWGKNKSDFLFANKDNKPISRPFFTKSLNDALKEFAKDSGKEIKSHSFRAAFITDLLEVSPIQDVQQIIGHGDIRTTQGYNRSYLTSRDAQKAIQTVYKKRYIARQKSRAEKTARKNKSNKSEIKNG